MRLSPEEIAEATGRPAPKKAPPSNALEDTVGKLDELDGRMAALTEQHRQPGETHEQAGDRLMRENPALYTEHKKAKAAIVEGNGLGNAAFGGTRNT